MKAFPGANFRHKRPAAFAAVLAILLVLCLIQTTPLQAVDATADPLSLGAHTSYTNTSCDDYSYPTVSGYYIGDSETPWHNAPVKRASAMIWCINQGYATGNALSTWWTGDGQCLAWPAGAGDSRTWGVTHHCDAIAYIRCCR